MATATRDHCTVITVASEIDITTTPRLADTLHHTPTILDLTDVTFIDAAGLHPILHAHHAAAAQHTPFIPIPTPAITRLLRLAELQHILHSRPALPDALTTVRAT